MRCCVQNCFNDDSKKTNKSLGVTFHRLPTDPEHSAAWLEVLTNAGCRMNKWLIVCSDHFLPEDFDNTRHNQRRVKYGVVPTLMSPPDQEELKVCRVCLALDVKMYDLKDFKLSSMFQNITGILAIDKKSSHLQQICWECTARLTAAAAFRDKALVSDALLKDVVYINKSDIEILKQCNSALKSTLTAQSLCNSSDIECEDPISKKKEIVLNVPAIKKRKTKIEASKDRKETEFEEYEPWIDVPVKTEIESDPIAEYSFNNQKNDTSPELHDDASCEDSEDVSRKIEVQVMINNMYLKENIITHNVPIVNDAEYIVGQDNVEEKPKLDMIGNIIEESSNEQNTQYTVKEVSVKNGEKRISSSVGVIEKCRKVDSVGDAVGTMNKTASIRNNEIKQKIIALKKKGLSAPAIAKETGITITSVHAFLYRYCKNSNLTYRRSSTLGRDQTIVENEPDEEYYYDPTETGKEVGNCSTTVRRRLRQAGLEHILTIKPERNMEQKISKYKALHDDLKERIVALKQEGLSNSRIAYLLETSRDTVRKWWLRYCKDGNMNNHKSTGPKRKTTAQEDQLLIDKVVQEQTVHTPSLAKELGISSKCVRSRLKEAGFKLKERKASVPLRSGRTHRVDEETKQQIISMKLNGVSVTEIANQFRVTRTSVYLWWRRWCKENNIKITSDNETHTETGQEESLTDDTNVENIVQTTPSIPSRYKSVWQKLPDVE